MVKINGESVNAEDRSISDYLKENGFDTKFVAVEINEEIVPKRLYGETFFKDGDCVEIVNFVGGG